MNISMASPACLAVGVSFPKSASQIYIANSSLIYSLRPCLAYSYADSQKWVKPHKMAIHYWGTAVFEKLFMCKSEWVSKKQEEKKKSENTIKITLDCNIRDESRSN